MKKMLAFVSALCMMCAVMPVFPVSEDTSISASALEQFKIEDGVLIYATLDCKGDVVIPDGVTSIKGSAFYGKNQITSVVIPEGVTSIGDAAFANCSKLNSITFPSSVTDIGRDVCEFCSSLESVAILGDVTTIRECAFRGCSALTSVTLPENLTTLEKYAFADCKNLASVTLPDSLTSIGYGAFEFTSLTSITIPENVETIGIDAFCGCRNLTSVTLPKSVSSVEEYAFSDCSALKTITFENPDCSIYDGLRTIPESTVIYGYENSTAQAYAEKRKREFVILESVPEETETPAEEVKFGDATGDGEIDILDVIAINKAVLGKESLTEAQLKAIDFNSNGKPDSDEALTLLKYIVGIITELK